MAIGRLPIKIEANTSGFRKGMREVDSRLRKTKGASFGKYEGGLGGVAMGGMSTLLGIIGSRLHALPMRFATQGLKMFTTASAKYSAPYQVGQSLLSESMNRLQRSLAAAFGRRAGFWLGMAGIGVNIAAGAISAKTGTSPGGTQAIDPSGMGVMSRWHAEQLANIGAIKTRVY